MLSLSVENAIKSWCLNELAAWMQKSVGGALLEEQARILNDTCGWIFVFDVDDKFVRLRSKEAQYTDAEINDDTIPYVSRMLHYRQFLSDVLSVEPVGCKLTLILDVSDGGVVEESVPVFAFQKIEGSHKILVPDPDFFYYRFYEDESLRDNVCYPDKIDKAIFVGSTTSGGSIISLDDVRSLSVPRLKSAIYFRDNPLVDFLLPAIVQCENEQVENALRELGFGVGRSSWLQQFQYKSLLSMDGNGATCSRVVVAMKSNSVLLKYQSNCLLYYFQGLRPWLHYVPILDDDDVVSVVEYQARNPEALSYISEESKSFHGQFLEKEPVHRYMGCLLRMYREVIYNG